MLADRPVGPVSFARERRGAAAVEFAMIAGLLMMTLGTALEVALLSYYQVQLERAVYAASREIRHGDDTLNGADVRGRFCAQLDQAFVNCDDTGYISLFVASHDDIGTIMNETSVLGRGQIDVGAPGDFTVIVATAEWKPIIPFFWDIVEASSGETFRRKFATNAVLRPEPDA